ncbi:MAG: hypothetical protein AAFP19_14125 [Bacteroidota bacterium]
MHSIKYALLFLLTILALEASAQGTQVEFGKNRVQYHQDFDEWLQYETQNFITYWYGEGRNIGQSVVQMAEMDYDAVQGILEHRMNERIEIIVYKDLTDIKQSNIGSEEAFVNTGGQTKIVGNKIFVYFNGDHNHLRQQIREGIANVYLNAMLFGSNLQEIVQNAVMLNLPEWFKQGLVTYVGKEWSTELDNQLRNLILQDKYKDFDKMAEEHPQLVGHAMWYFISQNYGRSTVSNLLYLTRINRSIDSGFLYVLGSTYRKTTLAWMAYFKKRYQQESDMMSPPEGEAIKIKNRRKLPINRVRLSPDGQKIVYVTNEIGKYKVYLHDLSTGNRKVILKGGFRNAFQATDYNYPMIAWSPNNQELTIIYERRDIIKTMRYDLNTGDGIKDVVPNQFHRIFSMDYLNVNTLILSASVRGFSDIFLYNMLNRQTERITNDFWDDLDAKVVKLDGKKGIIFSSNRADTLLMSAKLDTILPVNTFDLFYYDLEERSGELVRLTNTPLANERSPAAIDTTWFSYTTDKSGVYNRQMGYLEDVIAFYNQRILLQDSTEIVLHQDSSLASLDSSLIQSISLEPVYKKKAFTHNQTNYNRNIIDMHIAGRSNRMVEVVKQDEVYKLFLHTVNPNKRMTASPSRFRQQQGQVLQVPADQETSAVEENQDQVLEIIDEQAFEITEPLPAQRDTGKIDIDNYLFQSEFDEEEVPPTIVVEEDNGEIELQRPQEIERITETSNQPRVMKFRSSRIVPYRLKFKTDFVTFQLDNSLLYGGLDSYAGARQNFDYPPPGILIKGNFKDLFEDYEVEGGVRLPTTFNGAEYFLLFDNKKRRLDQRYAFYRRSLRNTVENLGSSFVPPKIEEAVIIGQYQVRYPLDIFRSIRGLATLRLDRQTLLATDANTLNVPSFNQQRFGIRGEYVFDNTLDVSLNIKNGTRYKIYGEMVKRFQVDLLDNVSFDFADGFMTILGLDARHYQRIDKHSIIALRAAAATSFGSEQILYFLGAVDNWIFPNFNDEIPFPTEGNFAYQNLASNMRGFRWNIRNGNSYALLNAELRVPLLRYFSRRIRSSFFRNFQVVGFFDVGTAWQGRTPFSDENPLNTITVENPTTSIKVNYFRDPIVAGYGFGVRSVLFGYFIRVDYAWGIETRIVQDPILYISIGMDF